MTDEEIKALPISAIVDGWTLGTKSLYLTVRVGPSKFATVEVRRTGITWK